MSLNYNVGPALSAELDYRREPIADAARGTWRVRLFRTRRAAGSIKIQPSTGRVGAAHPVSAYGAKGRDMTDALSALATRILPR